MLAHVPIPTCITSLAHISYIHKVSARLTGCLVGAVVSPVNAGNILIAVGDLSEGVLGTASLAALRQESEIRAPSRRRLALGLAEQLHGSSLGQGAVAGVEAIGADEAQLGDGVGELGEPDTRLALAGVDAHGLLAVGAGAIDHHAGGEEGIAALVGEDVGVSKADVDGSAVEVEDAAAGGSGVLGQHGEVLAGADVVGGQDEVVDGGGEVVGSDIGYQAEVGRGGLGRVDWDGASWNCRCQADEGQGAGEGES